MELWMAESAIRDTSPINTTVERVGLLFLLQLWLSHHETLGAICCLSAAKVRRIIGLAKRNDKKVAKQHFYILLTINILTFGDVNYFVFNLHYCHFTKQPSQKSSTVFGERVTGLICIEKTAKKNGKGSRPFPKC